MVTRKYRPAYLIPRLARRFTPERLAVRLLSKRSLPVKKLYEVNTRAYFRGLELTQGDNPFVNGVAPTILEAGTGVYNPASAPLFRAGASKIILLEPFLADTIDWTRFRERANAFLRLADEDDAFPLPRVEEMGDPLDRVEFSGHLWEDTGLPDGAVDFVLSISVLEHLRNPEAVLDETRRILRPGGWLISTVDMRDHYFKYPWEMLKYSERQWRLLTTQRGGSGYLNRWRINRWREALEERGFQVTVEVTHHFDSSILEERPLLDPAFRNLDDPSLRTAQALLAAQKL
ncbi:MAG: class I SAM-dependent methyltransferase [Candidatus Hydrogenedentota bacterium]